MLKKCLRLMTVGVGCAGLSLASPEEADSIPVSVQGLSAAPRIDGVETVYWGPGVPDAQLAVAA